MNSGKWGWGERRNGVRDGGGVGVGLEGNSITECSSLGQSHKVSLLVLFTEADEATNLQIVKFTGQGHLSPQEDPDSSEGLVLW